jgi:hypothetical protein
MAILKQNWWKLTIIVLGALATRIVLLQLLPLRSSSTFELPPSIPSQAIGMVPTAAMVITVCYAVIASVLMIIQENLGGGKLQRIILCSVPYSLIWLMAVLESVSSLGKPLLPELLIGLTDIVPILIIGVMVSSWTSRDATRPPSTSRRLKETSIFVIAFTYFVGRYLLYTLIQVNSGYLSQRNATFLWTLAFGLAVGLAYFMLREGAKGDSPISRGLWFGGIAFGLYWALNNFFMPIMFDMSFIQFDPPILNYVYRVVVDVIAVSFGVWMVEKAA